MNLRKEMYSRTLLMSILCLILSIILISTAVFGASSDDASADVSGTDLREAASEPVMAGLSMTSLFSAAPADKTVSEEYIASAVFAQDTVILYSVVDSAKASDQHTTGINYQNAVPQPLTVVAIITDSRGGVWYRLDTAAWSDMIKQFCFVRSEDIIVSDTPQSERVLSSSVNGMECTVSGNIPYDVTLSIEPRSINDIEGFDRDIYPQYDKSIALDITLRNSDGSEWQPASGESAEVSIPAALMSLSDGDVFFYYHIHDGLVEESDLLTVSNGMMTFATDSFSTFEFENGKYVIDAASLFDVTGNSGNGHAFFSYAFYDTEGYFHLIISADATNTANKYEGAEATLTGAQGSDDKTSYTSSPGVAYNTTQLILYFVDSTGYRSGQTSIDGKIFIDFIFEKNITISSHTVTVSVEASAGGFDIKPKEPNLTFDLDYHVGKSLYSTETTVKPGDWVEYVIKIENEATSSFPLVGAVIIDNLPIDAFDLSTILVSNDRTTWVEPASIDDSTMKVTMFDDVNIAIGSTVDYYLKAQISQDAKQGEKKNGVTISGTSIIDDSGETDTDITIEFPKSSYIVEHYKQNQDGTTYTLDTTEIFETDVLAYEYTEAAAKTYPNYHALPFEQVQIAEKTENGETVTVVKIYYDLDVYNVSYIVDGTEVNSVSYKVGDTIADYTPTGGTGTFDGWYTDSGCTSKWTNPGTMPASEIIVYGKFTDAPPPPTAKLTISKSGMEPGERAIFTVTGTGLGSGLKVVVNGSSGSTTISGLTLGSEYTVTEDNGWSWRYAPNSTAQKATPTQSNPTCSVSFSNSCEDLPWLCGETSAKNVFGKK